MLLEDARRIERERREQKDAERYVKLKKEKLDNQKNEGEDEKNDNLHKLDLFKNKKNRK